jgi:hypothetical protein
MAEGTCTFKGLAVPLFGESEIKQTTLGKDIITLTGAAGQTGDFLVCQSSAGAEKWVVDSTGVIKTMGLGSIALASLASDATASATLTGLTTACAIRIFPRAATTTAAIPKVWPSDADVIGYGGGGKTTAAITVNVWYFATA